MLRAAIDKVRETLGDRTAIVVVLAPSAGSVELLRRELALAGPFLRVTFATPDRLVRSLGDVRLVRSGARFEPAGWLYGAIAEALAALAEEGFRGAVDLTGPGWIPSFERAVRALEAAGVRAGTLEPVAFPEDLCGRRDLVAELLARVAARRERDGVAGIGELYAAAREGVDDATLPVNRALGVVVVPDTMLDAQQSAIIAAWLRPRAGVRVVYSPLDTVEDAPLGLGAIAADFEVVREAPTGTRAIDRLRRGLFGVREGGSTDDTVRIVKSPDELREMREVVRRVQTAIRAGTPLDRIAIALPDGSTAHVLEDALDTAGIPAVWLTGPSLARDPAARLLRQLVRVALEEDSVADWYPLLRHPLLRLSAQLGSGALVGSSRWRDVLAGCNANRGTSAICRALQTCAARLEDDDPGRKAHESCARVIATIAEDIAALPTHGSMSEHALAWRALAARWIGLKPERQQLDDVLASFGEGEGPPLTLAAALAQLESTLEAKPRLTGRIAEPKIRVLPPMEMLGGAFDLVCVVGLAEGRFPVRREEDVVLPDRMLDAIQEGTGRSLPRSTDLQDLERRRLAAAIASCTGSLWLSSPGTELMSARPQRPSRLLLDVASAILGRRASFEDVEAIADKAGSRARFGPDDPRDAISASEHWHARLASGSTEALASYATARRLMQLHRSIDRHRRARDEDRPYVDAWTGLVSAELVRCPVTGEGSASPHVFAEAVLRPGTYFFRRLLRAYAAKPLYDSYDPTNPKLVRRRAAAALRAAFDREGPQLLERFAKVWAEEDEALFEFRPEVAAGAAELARDLGRQLAEAMLERFDALPSAAVRTYDEQVVLDEWSLNAGAVLVGDERLVSVKALGKVPVKLKVTDAFAEMLEAAALGSSISDLTIVTAEDKVGAATVRALSTSVAELAAQTRRRAARGLWPMTKKDDRFCLAAEREALPDATDDALARLLEVIA